MAPSRAQPGKIRAALMAIAVHVIFIAFLIFGVSWQNKEPPAMQVELWDKLPAPPPPVQSEVEPPPAPLPKPEPTPKKISPPQPVVADTPSKDADIALKKAQRKKEKEESEELRLAKAEQKRIEQEKEKQQEKLLRDKQELERAKAKEQREQLEAKRLLEKRLAQLSRQEAAREAQEKLELDKVREAQLAAQAQREAQLTAASNSLVNDYKSRIRSKIKRFIILPSELTGNPQAEFDVTLMPSGEVLRVTLAKSSGSPAYDSAVERAIYKAQPLPLPPQTELFSQFRELHLKFRPNDEG